MERKVSFDFVKHASKVGGWLTRPEGQFLYESASNIKKSNSIVEIGSWKGKSTICLGKGSEQGYKARVYAIDPHLSSLHKLFNQTNTYKIFNRNIKNAKIDRYVLTIRKTSLETAKTFKKPIGLIFIDGAHDFRSVRLDYKEWFDKVVNGGIIAFHDSWRFIGPNLTTAIELITSSKIRNPELIDTITHFEKVNKNSLSDRIKNILFLIYRTLFGFKGAMKLNSQSEMFE